MSTAVTSLDRHPFLTRQRHQPQRWVVGGFAIVAGAAHIPVTGPHLTEAPYMGLLFIALTISCFVLALSVLIRDTRAVYTAVVVICGLALIGYAATRLVAFPMLSDDVGNWLEPLGIVSILAEATAVGFAVSAIAPHRSPAPSTR